ncbi:hypothetical protein MGU_10665 [Metarhizium guizhouense ARSEF 977]|uniref:Uncharacterized protein n=1 Tax=Metarhizium guizhouense (strain ARSEF 977) TaxID=1276136 RepID=A0A0B4GWX6_METGA|nr:hypothetical protein MGU_10665 [Metarhizium guizhouense ARSEF 977]
MFGKALAKIRGCWTRPTNISELDLSNIHGHIFVLDSNCQFHPYEYRQGAPPPMDKADDAFVTALAKYLQTRRQTTLIGLQVLNEDKTKQMQEFVLGDNNGAIMLDANDTNINESYRVTGFAVAADQPGGISELKGNETHSPTTRSTHQVFTDGKALPNEESLVDVLRNDGIIDRG